MVEMYSDIEVTEKTEKLLDEGMCPKCGTDMVETDSWYDTSVQEYCVIHSCLKDDCHIEVTEQYKLYKVTIEDLTNT